MIQGIYIASQGMSALVDKQDQISNNLANINTTGFKQSGLFIKTFQKYLGNDQQQPYVNNQIKSDEVYIDYSEGSQIQTEAPLDASIRGSGFFTVMTPNGVRYTRNGNFSINPDGLMVNADGSKVMSRDGFIRLDSKEPVSILENGEVMQGSTSKGILKIADFAKPYKMLREGNSYFKPLLPDNPAIESAGFSVRQGFLEGSNASSIKNMTSMISTYRAYEAGQKALQSQDDTLDKAVNQVGRIGG